MAENEDILAQSHKRCDNRNALTYAGESSIMTGASMVLYDVVVEIPQLLERRQAAQEAPASNWRS